MLRYFIIIITTGLLIFATGCSEDPASSGGDGGETFTFTTGNVKTIDRQYYSFSTNTVSTSPGSGYDLMFMVGSRVEEVGDAGSNEFFDIGSDPIIISGSGISTARIDAVDLSEVTTIPGSGDFHMDDTTKSAVIGGGYLDNAFAVLNDVYVIKNAEGNYGLMQVKEFVYNPAVHQVTSLKIYYKFNDNGSNDFTSSPLDSMDTANGYEGKLYMSFADGDIGFGYGLWDFEIEGRDIWLGPKATMLKLTDTEISTVTTVPTTGYTGDQLPQIASASWYDSDVNHKVIPKNYVYMLTMPDNKHIAYEVTNYYDDQGNSGVMTVVWKKMD